MRIVLATLALSAAGCIVAGSQVREREVRDDRLVRQIAQQQRWAQQALDARPTKDQLDRIRQSDFSAVAAGRKELQRLIQAIDRGTWVRNAAAELLREESEPQLLQEFDRAGDEFVHLHRSGI